MTDPNGGRPGREERRHLRIEVRLKADFLMYRGDPGLIGVKRALLEKIAKPNRS